MSLTINLACIRHRQTTMLIHKNLLWDKQVQGHFGLTWLIAVEGHHT